MSCLHPKEKLLWYDDSLHCFLCRMTWHDIEIIKRDVPQAGGHKIWGRPDPEEVPVLVTCQDKAIELTDRFPEQTHQRREDLCAAFSEAIEWGRMDERKVKNSNGKA